MSFLRRYINFTVFAVVATAAALSLSFVIDPVRAVLAGFDAGAIVFLVLIVRKAMTEKSSAMRTSAASNEPDRHTLNIFAWGIVAIVITAVWIELTGHGGNHGTGIALAALTLVMAWLFANTLFGLHYAHVWYLRDSKGKDQGGLDFPGDDPTPDYWDFAYFAYVLGMTFQVSDVQITSKRMRRIALIHGLVAFFFNIAVLALSVNLVATAIGG